MTFVQVGSYEYDRLKIPVTTGFEASADAIDGTKYLKWHRQSPDAGNFFAKLTEHSPIIFDSHTDRRLLSKRAISHKIYAAPGRAGRYSRLGEMNDKHWHRRENCRWRRLRRRRRKNHPR